MNLSLEVLFLAGSAWLLVMTALTLGYIRSRGQAAPDSELDSDSQAWCITAMRSGIRDERGRFKAWR
jgi:hypothetical protein